MEATYNYLAGISSDCKSEVRQYFARYGHRLNTQSKIIICNHCGLPLPLQLSRDQGLSRACAFKEFRFEPPYVSKKKERRRKKLPPIPENMLPRSHDIINEELEEDDDNSEIPPLPSLSISPAFITERVFIYLFIYLLSVFFYFHKYT